MRKIVSRREFVSLIAPTITASAARSQASAGREQQPNILFVFADQFRFSELGCMGNSYVQTPHFDRMASRGMALTNAYSSAPVCSPYRAQLITGKFGHRNGVPGNDIKLPENQETIAKVLRRGGYATGYIGKWHLEGGRRAPQGTARYEGFVPAGPARQGFDFWAALECSHQYFHTKYYRDTPEPILIDGYEPDVQTDVAIEFLRQNRSRPFCLMMSWGPPHGPYKPPGKYAIYDPAKVPLRPNVPREMQDEARRTIAEYYGLITSLDDNMGRIVKTLDALSLANNTLLCFSSDHGDMLYSQGHILKQKPWEESCHVPFFVQYPRRIRAGQRKDVLFNSVDIMPTLLGFSGVQIPEGVQGRDLSRVLAGDSKDEPDSLYLALDSGPLPRGAGGPWRAVRTKQWKYAAKEGSDWLLYNLVDDPFERRNLVSDTKYDRPKTEMKRLLARWIEQT